jgi:hypothetical protein
MPCQATAVLSDSRVPRSVLPVGTLLLLDTQCEAFTKLVKPSQIAHSLRKRKRNILTYDAAGIPIAPSARVTDEAINTDKFIQVLTHNTLALLCLLLTIR